eukprot:3313009-Rhodomonas_salina.3
MIKSQVTQAAQLNAALLPGYFRHGKGHDAEESVPKPGTRLTGTDSDCQPGAYPQPGSPARHPTSPSHPRRLRPKRLPPCTLFLCCNCTVAVVQHSAGARAGGGCRAQGPASRQMVVRRARRPAAKASSQHEIHKCRPAQGGTSPRAEGRRTRALTSVAGVCELWELERCGPRVSGLPQSVRALVSRPWCCDEYSIMMA